LNTSYIYLFLVSGILQLFQYHYDLVKPKLMPEKMIIKKLE
jgi:hypothetical protein